MKITREKNLDEIKNGYTKDKRNFYHCNFCDAVFEDGEIFPINGHFYRAEKAVQMHIQKEHGSVFEQLLQLENPYHCPHGRPTIITMSKYELEGKFKRII